MCHPVDWLRRQVDDWHIIWYNDINYWQNNLQANAKCSVSGRYLGSFKQMTHHPVRGDLTVRDEQTFTIKNFVYDGEGKTDKVGCVIHSILLPKLWWFQVQTSSSLLAFAMPSLGLTPETPSRCPTLLRQLPPGWTRSPGYPSTTLTSPSWAGLTDKTSTSACPTGSGSGTSSGFHSTAASSESTLVMSIWGAVEGDSLAEGSSGEGGAGSANETYCRWTNIYIYWWLWRLYKYWVH